MFGLKKKVPAQAKIIADEGYGMAMNSGEAYLHHQQYIVEVHPETEPAFRVEVKAWVSWPDMPAVGDVVRVLYVPGTKKVELDLEGDPRFDWKLRKAQAEQAAAAERERLLNEPTPQGPLDGGAPKPRNG
jgi:hypothetical protein